MKADHDPKEFIRLSFVEDVRGDEFRSRLLFALREGLLTEVVSDSPFRCTQLEHGPQRMWLIGPA
jgi:hypothetical protein